MFYVKYTTNVLLPYNSFHGNVLLCKLTFSPLVFVHFFSQKHEFGYKINLVEGEEENVKVTTKKDLNYLF